MSRVLVTGARGFIGRHTLRPLVDAGLEVHAVSSCGGPPAEIPAEAEAQVPIGAEAPPEVLWHRADLLAPETAYALIAQVRPSHLLHLAWYTRPGNFWTAPENLDWLAGSLALLHAFGESGGRRVVVAGTCAEYAWQRRTHCVEEGWVDGASDAASAEGYRSAVEHSATPLRPVTLYGAAKHALHVAAAAWARQTRMGFAWGRVFHVYGPYEQPERLVSGVACALLRGEEALCTHGAQVRDFLYAPDLGAAFAALLLSEAVGPLNMASGKPTRVADVVSAIAAAAGRPELVRLGVLPADPEEPAELTADVRRLREEVGWSPSHDLWEGAELTVAWWRGALEGAGTKRHSLPTGHPVPKRRSLQPESSSMPEGAL
jgi:nucleoside-diphosphate-sugar epimerase